MVDILDEFEFLKLLKKLSKFDDDGELVFSFNANHFVICTMLAKSNKEAAKFYATNKIGFKKEDIKELLEHGYLTFIVPNEYDLYNFKIEEEVIDLLVANKKDFKEFFYSFPKTFVIDGRITSARNCDYDRLEEFYLKLIKQNKIMHKFIMKGTENYKKLLKTGETNPMGIEKYIKGRNYETYAELESDYENSEDDNYSVL